MASTPRRMKGRKEERKGTKGGGRKEKKEEKCLQLKPRLVICPFTTNMLCEIIPLSLHFPTISSESPSEKCIPFWAVLM